MKNFWKVDLSEMDIIFFFLMPSIIPKLKEKFEKELKPNTKIIVYVWGIKGWEPKKIDKEEKRPKIYLYER